MVRLGDICTQITDGSHNPPVSVGESSYLMLSSKNIDDDSITLNDPRYLSKDDFDTENKRTNIEPDDLLMTIVGTIGRVAIVPNELTKICVQRSVAVLKPKSDIVYNRFLMYYLQNMRPYLEQESRGVAQKGIYLKQIGNLTISLPLLTEQRKIAAVLDKVSSLIAKRRQQMDKLDLLIKARFVEMFGDPKNNPYKWNMQRLDEICENLDSRRIPITSTDRKAGIYPYYGASGIVDYVEDYIFDEDILLISEDGANLVMRATPIAFSVSGKVWVNNHAHVVRFDSKASQKYIEVCFELTDISGSITGTAQPKLNQAKLNAMMFCMPPLELQNQFAAFVEQTEKTKTTISESLEKLETLKKKLMQEYFG